MVCRGVASKFSNLSRQRKHATLPASSATTDGFRLPMCFICLGTYFSPLPRRVYSTRMNTTATVVRLGGIYDFYTFFFSAVI